MKNMNFVSYLFVALLFVNYLGYSYCGICELCMCTQSEDTRIVNCQGKRDFENYTEIFDLLSLDVSEPVKKFVISNHDITTLPLDAFRGLKRLESLDLSVNSIVNFEADIFKDLNSLRELDFSFNLLETLNGAVFNNIQNLLILNLSNNRIGDLNETTAGQLPKLTNLDLSHNNLNTIDCDFIKSLVNLKFFNVSHNRIISLTNNALLPLSSLTELRINNNLLEIISGKNVPVSLTTLNVAGNLINSLNLDLSQVRYLNIADNAINAIENEAVWLKKLKYLNISGNSLKTFSELKFDDLRVLDVSRNNLSIIPKTLSSENLPILETLMIDGNPIRDLRFVEELRLQRFYARRLDGLESIESNAFVKLKGINDECVDLVISENPRLKRISEGAFNVPAICSLDLSKNAITRISLLVLKSMNKFVVEGNIDLQGNPFNCNCESQWMLDELVPHLYTTNPELLEDLRCDEPFELSGTRMVHWLMWKKRVFCETTPAILSRMMIDSSTVIENGETTIRLESSRGMLAVVAGALGTLCVLVVIGIVVARKVGIRRRRVNRRF